MKLTLPSDYIHQAATLINEATDRIFLIAMVVADHPETHELIAALEAAAKRGVAVTVAADVFTYGEVNGSFLPVKYYSPNAKLATKMAKNLRAAGVKFHWLGRGRITLLSGRTHSKWCVIDNTVFTFGGVNIYNQGITNIDYMFKLVNNRLADRLAYEQDRIQRADRSSTNYPSLSYELNGDSVLIDGGIISQSIIYRRACELARDASKVLFVSQYCPTGKLGRILKTKDAKVYFNQPHQAHSFNRWLIRLSLLTSGIKTLYTKERYLHSKFIIFTMSDGSKVALTGSHNFAYTGVLFGTREIALETKDPAVISQLESFYRAHIA